MYLNIFIVLLLACCTSESAKIIKKPIEATTDSKVETYENYLVDNLISATMKRFEANIDPLAIEDRGWDVERRVPFFNIRGVAKMSKTALHGLKSFKRAGDVKIDDLDGATSRMTFHFMMSKLNYTTNTELTLAGVGLRQRYIGKIDKVRAEMTIKLNKARDDKLSIMTLKIHNLENFTIRLDQGNILTRGLQNFFIRQVMRYAQQAIKLGLEVTLSRLFDVAIKDNKELRAILS